MHRASSHGAAAPPGEAASAETIRGECHSRAFGDDGLLVTNIFALRPAHAFRLLRTMDDLVCALDHVDGTHVSITLPQIYLAALDESLLTDVASYLAAPRALTGVHIRRDIGDQVGGIKRWHLDSEDARVVRLISYLEDVDLDNDPIEFVPENAAQQCAALQMGGGSLGPPLAPMTDEMMASLVPAEHWRLVTGPRATCVLVDTARIFHRTRPHKRTRLSLTFTYSTRTPTHPKARRNPHLDQILSKFQAECFFAATPDEATT